VRANQFAHVEGLGQRVVGAELEADNAVDLLAARGEHEHRRGRGLPHPAQDIDAAQARQHPMEDDQIGALMRVEIECAYRRWSC
jgi:hypothetical protein